MKRQQRKNTIPLILGLFLPLLPLNCVAAARSEVNGAPENLPKIKMCSVRRIGKHKGYSVDVRYPYFSGGQIDVTRKLNRVVKRTVDMNIPNTPVPEDCFGYRCTFQKYLVTPRFVSLCFIFDNDTGGARGDSFKVPLNFQLYPEFKSLKLNDVFGRKKINYSKLKVLCLKEGLEVKDGDVLNINSDEYAPDFFDNFAFDKKGIVFFEETLPGEIESVKIPFKVLHELIGPNSIIKKIPSR